MAGNAQIRLQIAEGLIDDKHAAVRLHHCRHCQDVCRLKGAAGRVVGVDHHRKAVVRTKLLGAFHPIDSKAGGRQHARIFTIGGAENGNPAAGRSQPRQQLDHRLGAGNRQGLDAVGPVIARGSRACAIDRQSVGQPVPGLLRHIRQLYGAWIDAGRQV
ncbi:hypothetical protein D9M72_482570 [compost metagenome]